MSSQYCSLDDAFAGQLMKKSKKSKTKVGETEPDGIPEAMTSPPPNAAKPEATAALQDFFPIPGETAGADEWSKAFMLEPSLAPVPIAGKPTLWRQQQLPPAELARAHGEGATSLITTNDSIHKRLDALARQLDALTTGNPMQSTAELFLFIAIGLLFILAIDTLLRCATTVALANKGGLQSGGYRQTLASTGPRWQDLASTGPRWQDLASTGPRWQARSSSRRWH